MSRYDDDYPRKESRSRNRDSDMFKSPNPKRLFKSREQKVWLGVCGGLAERYGWDAALVRILAVVATIFFAGPLMLVGYIAMAIVTPKAPISRRTMAPDEEQFWTNVSDRPRTTASGLKYTFMDLEDRLRNIERKVTSDDWRLKKAFRDLEKN